MTGEPDPREQAVRDRCAELLTKMAALRDFRPPPADTDPPTVHEALRDDLRGRLDQAESLMSEMTGYRFRAQRLAAAANAEAAGAYDEALSKLSARAVTREYESIKDREVSARVKSSKERREALAAERLLSIVLEAEKVMQSMFFGLRDVRKELLASLESYLPWQASIERT